MNKVLGPLFGAYLVQGALEAVSHDCPPPVIVNPTGVVDKNLKVPDKYRAISDARDANRGNRWDRQLGALAVHHSGCGGLIGLVQIYSG